MLLAVQAQALASFGYSGNNGNDANEVFSDGAWQQVVKVQKFMAMLVLYMLVIKVSKATMHACGPLCCVSKSLFWSMCAIRLSYTCCMVIICRKCFCMHAS